MASASDRDRLRRAAERPITRVGPGQYAVQGNVEPIYYVDLSQDPPCQCRDAQYRNAKCLHTIAALLQARDPMMLNALIDDYARRLEREENDG